MTKGTRLALCCCVSVLAGATAAQAQDAPAAANAQAGEDGSTIIVTARRRDEAAQDAPLVVNTVSEKQLQQLNLRDFTEVQTLVPGLNLKSSENGIGGSASIRGVNFDIFLSGNNPTVEFYLNEAPITAGIVLQQAYDIGQVEVLRGPQGTLRGRSSPSGSITVAPNKPDLYRIGGTISATGNDIGTINVNGALSIPIVEGVAAIRVAGVWDENEVDRVRPLGTAIDKRDPFSRTRSGRVTGVLKPLDWLRFEGMYQRVDRSIRSYRQVESFSLVNPAAPASPVLIHADDRRSINELSQPVRQKFDIFTWRGEASFAGQQLIYVGSQKKQRITATESVDGGNFFPAFDVFQSTATRSKDTSHEIRLQNQERVLGMFDYVVGFFDNKGATTSAVLRQTPIVLPPLLGGRLVQVVPTNVLRVGSLHEQSLFGNVTAHVTDKLEISAGGRYIDYKSQSQLLVNGALVLNDPTDETKFIYTGSIKYNFSPNFMVYASTGTSWRPGPTAIGDFSVVKSARQLAFTSLPAEESTTYEAGFKSTLMDGKLRANLSAFYQDFKNYPYRVPGSGVYYTNYNATVSNGNVVVTPQVGQFNFAAAVPVEVYGLEGELAYDITRDWNLGLVASYALGKIKGGVIPCNDLNGDGTPDNLTSAPTLAQLQAAYGANNLGACTVNQRSSFQSPFSATLTSEYRFGISNAVDAYARGLFTWFGKSQADPTNAFDDVGAYGLLNVFAGIRDPKGMWEVQLFAKNLLDTTKVLTRTTPLSTAYQELVFGGIGPNGPIFTGAQGRTFTSSYNGITTTPPREFGVNIRFAFGAR